MEQQGVSANRLNGWKAISNYFGCDRSTVMRWAQNRKLPVYRVPGGKQGSVFALEHELAAWSVQLGSQPDQTEPDQPAETIETIATEKPPRSWPWAVPLLVAVLALAFLAALFIGNTVAPTPKAEMPANAVAATDYLSARDHWAKRTPKDLGAAIKLYQTVITREPNFAPAYAGLAEAWLVFREYGEVGDLEAYSAAQTAAIRALALDPDLPSAHRAMGFIHYWRENDGPRAIASFKRAIALDARDSQTHFWFANVLADLGDHTNARTEYDRARLLSPGSRIIEVEAACAEWQAGRDASALERLNALAKRYPEDATIHNCLAWVHISHGDIVKFAEEYAIMARDRHEAVLMDRANKLSAAVVRNPRLAHRIVTADMRRELARGERLGRETPALYASAMGDRSELLALMIDARKSGEIWYSASITSRIAARWRDDAEIMRLLKTLRAPSTKPNGA